MEELLQLVDGTHRYRSAWIEIGKVRCYFRCNHRSLPIGYTKTLDLANFNIEEEERGKGYFTKWLGQIEAFAFGHNLTVFIENVINERLGPFFVRRGYTPCKREPESYYLCPPNGGDIREMK